jgi:hypothetical protein
MSVCTQCGHPLGVGRFCTNCGQPVVDDGPVSEENVLADNGHDDWHTDTAERPAVTDDVEHTVVRQRPILPPPVTGPNEPPRYPLYADEVDPAAGTTMTSHMPPVMPPILPPPAQPAGDFTDTSSGSFRHVGDRPPRSPVTWLPWVVGAVVMLLVAAVGIWLLLGNDDDTTPPASDPGPTGTAPSQPASSQDQQNQPTNKPGKHKSPKPGKPADVSRSATASAPQTAPPNEDVAGNLVRYEPRNMLDGVPETTWRMAGDGAGETLTFRLDKPTTITEVGLINGYAKTSREGNRTFDWYHGNRRVLAVEWRFDDGMRVGQDFNDTRNLQTIEVDDATTRSVQLRLVDVSPPGSGPSGRNYTAISEVSLVGVPG